jgi:hypothetical protein
MGLWKHLFLIQRNFTFVWLVLPTAILDALFPYLWSILSIEEKYSLAQVVTFLLKIYTTTWKVVCGGGVLSLGKCMSNVIICSKMSCV